MHVLTHRAIDAPRQAARSRVQFALHDRADPAAQWRRILAERAFSCLFVFISGHGYSQRDTSGDELDGRDEALHIGRRVVLDDTLRATFVEALPAGTHFIGVCDTCHSGSMFDLDFVWRRGAWCEARARSLPRACCDAVAIGACADGELDQCDIGDHVGFGGALTVQLLERGALARLLRDALSATRVIGELAHALRALRQTPQLERSFANGRPPNLLNPCDCTLSHR